MIMCNEIMCIHNTLRLSTSYDKVEDLPVLRKCSAFSEYFENLPLFFPNFIGVGPFKCYVTLWGGGVCHLSRKKSVTKV